MADEEHQPEAHEPAESSLNDRSIGDSLSELTAAAATGIPPQAQRNLWKAFGRVVQAGVEWPEGYLKGKGQITKAAASVEVARLEAEASEIRSRQKAREIIMKESAKASLSQLKDPKTALRALDFHFEEITRDQRTREDILMIGARELQRDNFQVDAATEIEDDWLFAFLKIATTRTKDQWKEVFGRILAGEIKSPGSFSIGTVEIFARLDQNTANIFRIACNLSTMTELYARVVTMPGLSIGDNTFRRFGLSYDDVARLMEVGLIRSELQEYTEYAPSEVLEGIRIEHAGIPILIKPADCTDGQAFYPASLMMEGPGFTHAGGELRNIMAMDFSIDYLRAMADYVGSQGLDLYMSTAGGDGISGWAKIDRSV